MLLSESAVQLPLAALVVTQGYATWAAAAARVRKAIEVKRMVFCVGGGVGGWEGRMCGEERVCGWALEWRK